MISRLDFYHVFFHVSLFNYCNVFACVIPTLCYSLKCSSTYILLRPVSQEMDANLHVTPVSGAGVNISCLCVKDETQIQYQASLFSQASCSRPIVELLLQMLITILPPSFFRIQSRNCDGTRALILFSWMCGRD